jgi:hypothetical protein
MVLPLVSSASQMNLRRFLTAMSRPTENFPAGPGLYRRIARSLSFSALGVVKIEPNRAKPRELVRFFPVPVRHRALTKYPVWAKPRWPPRRILWPKPGIFIRRGALGIAALVRDPGAISIRQNTKYWYFTILPRFARTVLDVAPEGGPG